MATTSTSPCFRLPTATVASSLLQYIHPTAIDTAPTRPNEIGMHRVAFSVDDIDEALAIAASHGCHPLRGVAMLRGVYSFTYVRGPSGIIVMLAQELTREGGDARPGLNTGVPDARGRPQRIPGPTRRRRSPRVGSRRPRGHSPHRLALRYRLPVNCFRCWDARMDRDAVLAAFDRADPPSSGVRAGGRWYVASPRPGLSRPLTAGAGSPGVTWRVPTSTWRSVQRSQHSQRRVGGGTGA